MLGLLVWWWMSWSPGPPGAGQPGPAPPPDALEPAPPPTCALAVEGMPVALLGHHQLVVGADDVRTLDGEMAVVLTEDPLLLRIRGPRYRGAHQLSARECDRQRPTVLHVEPLPATIEFPCPPPDLTVTCERCPGAAGDGIFLAEELPPIEMDSHALRVELLLRAPGYHRDTVEVLLRPGRNSVRVFLDPLP